jgi:hypothetical protein
MKLVESDLFETLRRYLGYFGIFWDILGYFVIFWDILGYFVIFWDILGYLSALLFHYLGYLGIIVPTYLSRWLGNQSVTLLLWLDGLPIYPVGKIPRTKSRHIHHLMVFTKISIGCGKSCGNSIFI